MELKIIMFFKLFCWIFIKVVFVNFVSEYCVIANIKTNVNYVVSITKDLQYINLTTFCLFLYPEGSN